MDIVKFDEMKKTWYQISHNSSGNIPPDFELQIYKKMLNIFHVGDYYYYILNIPKIQMEFISDSILGILKLQDKTVFSPQYIFENMHPDERSRFLLNEKKVTEFFSSLTPEQVLKYKVSYDYRIKKADGDYIWVLMQTTTIQTDENGAVIRVLGVHTDITHLKTDNKCSGLSFIGLEGEPSYYNVEVNSQFLLPAKALFSKREKEVLQLMLLGKGSTEIAMILNVSIHTINSHRKNILTKSGCTSLVELGSKSVREGWI